MTIAQAFNEITVAQGGTPSNSGTVAGAIDALNDVLAGSDQPAEQTIEAAVRLLGQHIGGGGGGSSTVRVWFANQDDPSDMLDSLTVKDGSGDAIETKVEEYQVQGTTLNLKCADVQAGTPIVFNLVPIGLSVAWDYPYSPTIESDQNYAYFIMAASETLAFFNTSQ